MDKLGEADSMVKDGIRIWLIELPVSKSYMYTGVLKSSMFSSVNRFVVNSYLFFF